MIEHKRCFQKLDWCDSIVIKHVQNIQHLHISSYKLWIALNTYKKNPIMLNNLLKIEIFVRDLDYFISDRIRNFLTLCKSEFIINIEGGTPQIGFYFGFDLWASIAGLILIMTYKSGYYFFC